MIGPEESTPFPGGLSPFVTSGASDADLKAAEYFQFGIQMAKFCVNVSDHPLGIQTLETHTSDGGIFVIGNFDLDPASLQKVAAPLGQLLEALQGASIQTEDTK